jgi:hypothetical protein
MLASPRNAWLSLSALWLYLTVVVFGLTAGILQWSRTDLDPFAMPLSAYLSGPGGTWLRGAYYFMATGLACLAWASYRVTREDLRSRLASALFLISAITLPIVAATVLYQQTPQENLAQLIHGEAAQTTFLCLVMALVLLSSRWVRDPGMRYMSYLGVMLAWLAFAQMWLLALWKGLPSGLMQKALIGLILLWLGWAARQLRRASAARD